MRTSYVSGRPRLERRLPAALVLVPVELASLAGGFTDVFGEIQQRIGWRGRSEDDLQSFVIEHDLRLCLHVDPQSDDEALECLVGDLAGGIREVSSMIWPDETGCACQR